MYLRLVAVYNKSNASVVRGFVILGSDNPDGTYHFLTQAVSTHVSLSLIRTTSHYNLYSIFLGFVYDLFEICFLYFYGLSLAVLMQILFAQVLFGSAAT